MTDLDDLRHRAADLPIEVHGDGRNEHVFCADEAALDALKAEIGQDDPPQPWDIDPFGAALFGTPVYVGQCPCAPSPEATPSTGEQQ